MTSTTVVISIGRNIGAEPMRSKDWRSFKDDVTSALERHHADVFLFARGSGEWIGNAEQSAVWIATVSHPLILRWELEKLAAQWQQDAIGYVVHDTDAFGDSLAYRRTP